MIHANGDRLLADLATLSRIGATAAGGVNRPAYSDADVETRVAVQAMMRDAGLEVSVDAAGNTFGRCAGSAADAKPIIIGSHTDSVPDGGRYDGPLGVLAALEVARALGDERFILRHALEVVNFQNEEGGLVGSTIVAGRFPPDGLARRAVSGYTIAEGIARLGGSPDRIEDARRQRGSIAGYLELHIEQGRVLERAGADIGVVEGLVGIRYWAVTFSGVASHAGTTPMSDRHDALVAASRFVDAVDRVVRAEPGRHVGTVGQLTVFPGGANVVPGRVALTLELRDLDLGVVARLYDRLEAEARRIAADTGTTVALDPTHTNLPALTSPSIQDAVSRAANALGLRTHTMPSGAGHDAQNMSAIGPSGMIFVPSVDGISHSPREFTRDEDVRRGADTLLGAVLLLDEAQ